MNHFLMDDLFERGVVEKSTFCTLGEIIIILNGPLRVQLDHRAGNKGNQRKRSGMITVLSEHISEVK